MRAAISVPGSCGELVQGVIDDTSFHITCPVNIFSKAVVLKSSNGFIEIPESNPKVRNAVEVLNRNNESPTGFTLQLQSELPHGKGMASSTADIIAALASVVEVYGHSYNIMDLARIALEVEPTDGTFFDGIVAFDHREGRLLEHMGIAIPADIVVFEPPDAIDTVQFNRADLHRGSSGNGLIKEAFNMVQEGLKNVDLKLVGEAATLSARNNQTILFKKELPDLIDISRRYNGKGIVIAHSGTVMGILVNKDEGEKLLNKISHYAPKHWKAYVLQLIDGGIRHD